VLGTGVASGLLGQDGQHSRMESTSDFNKSRTNHHSFIRGKMEILWQMANSTTQLEIMWPMENCGPYS